MTVNSRRAGLLGLLLAGTFVLAACGTGPSSAPVEERRTSVSRPVMDPNTVAVKQPPGFENAGKVGYYTVKPGETLIRIGLETGQNWKDIAAWNNLAQPNQIEVGQVLRVTAPVVAGAVAATENGGVVTRPIGSSSIASTQVQPGQASSAAARPAATAAAEPAAAAAAAESGLSWIWPVPGPVLAGFDEVKNKGLDLGGAAGEPVLAAADGRVVYVGAGLRGYGNLIILKHNNTYLTAYAHNKSLLVKEDQAVRKGQKIAEMGNSDADRVKLHFEVRRQGKPVDPLKYLPPR
ncbi:peptidoglycan DD-metalloendopeptidase family protein [Rhodoferax sp. BAB1]|uniref:peptidoglycan DD-metalloendopeptidase family protein n=1 Tax=Rhodoferax sp. BAB1 TaxID=2741720 RepID=UPI0015769492|nr:peptidoglycan DD-metalloendopeptidase family protein [Rhodoferax sp. BAB1]QKO22067.1 peptidoglycan DD-metalloendopeptidase family protein [Rhodoferax sp. BAB1]